MPQSKTKSKKRTTPKKDKVVEISPDVLQDMPVQNPDGQYTVDPSRIANKLQQKNNELSLQLAMTEAAFEQEREMNSQLRAQIDDLNAQLADDGSEEEDEE